MRVKGEKKSNYVDEDYLPITLTDENIETVFKIRPPVSKVKGGYGYYGVLLRNKHEDKLQCHICGRWFIGLSTHIFMAHKISTREYKRRFSLPIAFPLVSRGTSAKHSKRQTSLEKLEHLTKVRNMKKLQSVPKKKRKKFMKYATTNLAFQNMHGVCPEQIVNRYLGIADMIGKEPSMREIIKHDPALESTINRRYGNINNFRKANNFTVKPRAKLWTDAGLIAVLIKFYKEKHRIPCHNDFKYESPCSHTFLTHFGSWTRALKMAGFDVIDTELYTNIARKLGMSIANLSRTRNIMYSINPFIDREDIVPIRLLAEKFAEKRKKLVLRVTPKNIEMAIKEYMEIKERRII